jgi:hypothetical protein
MRNIRDFLAIHGRVYGVPPKGMEPVFQDVWKLLQKFAGEDPMAFYELVRAATDQKVKHKPNEPWKGRIIAQGFGGTSGQEGFVVHDLVLEFFERYLRTSEVTRLPTATTPDRPRSRKSPK